MDNILSKFLKFEKECEPFTPSNEECFEGGYKAALAALVAEIKRRIKEIDEIGTYLSPKGVLTNLLCRLDTIEVKDVDLDNELDFVKDAYYYFTSDERGSMKKVAKHFFELGLKAQKGV